MKKYVFVPVVVLLVSLLCSVPSYSADKADTVKIGVVDMQKVVIDSKGGKEVKAQFEREMTEMRKAYFEKEGALKKLRSEIDKGGISAKEKKEKEEIFQKEVMVLKRLRDDSEAGLRDMEKTITTKLISEIRDVILKVGEEGKYTIILEKDASILFMPNSIDLTGKVIENYDKQKSKK